jgi:hypothetical protein
MLKRATCVLLSAAALMTGKAQATVITDAAGDFLPTYTGPRNGDLDVLSITVTTDGAAFTITALMAGAIGTTTGGRYIWGVNRGRGTPGFAAIGLNNVLFDTVIALNNDGTGSVNLLSGSPATALAAGSVTISGNTISAIIPYSLLPTNGLVFANYGFNLWPRAPGAGNAFLSDFAPDNATISTPEPAAIALMGLAFAGLGLARRRKA